MELQPALSSRRGRDEDFTVEDVDLDNLDLDDLLLDEELSNFLDATDRIKQTGRPPGLPSPTFSSPPGQAAPGFAFSYPYPGGGPQQQQQQQPGLLKGTFSALKGYFFPANQSQGGPDGEQGQGQPPLNALYDQQQQQQEQVFSSGNRQRDFDPFLLDDENLQGMDPSLMLGSHPADPSPSPLTSSHTLSRQSHHRVTRAPRSPTSTPSPSPYYGQERDLSKKRKLGEVSSRQQDPSLSAKYPPQQAVNGAPQPEASAESILQGSVVTTSTPEDMLKALNESFAQQSEIASRKKQEIKRQMKLEGYLFSPLSFFSSFFVFLLFTSFADPPTPTID